MKGASLDQCIDICKVLLAELNRGKSLDDVKALSTLMKDNLKNKLAGGVDVE